MLKFHIIESGYFMGDGGVMFGPVPKKYWSKRYKTDENNMCRMSMRCIFIETDDRRILVDSGMGNKQLDKLKFYQPHDLKNIADEIRTIGYEAEQVTDVVLTHLHFDHCGGCTFLNDKQEIVPTFPNATHWVSLAQWKNYRNPGLFDKSSYSADNIEVIFNSGHVQFVLKDVDLCEGVRLELYNGHTPGQIVVLFDTPEDKYAYPADVAPTSLNLNLGWLSAHDNNLALAMEEKKRFFDKVKKDNRTIVFYHDAYLPMAKL